MWASNPVGRVLFGGLLLLGVAISVGVNTAKAQAIVTAVNGDPITTFDIDEHAKILKLTRRPAGREAALEDVIADRLKFDEARKWGIDAADSDITAVLARLAAESKMQPQAWAEAAQRAHIDMDTVRYHLRALGAWDAFVRSRNKTLGVSDEEISAQLAKQGTAAKITDYDLRQVVFVVPVGASPAVIDARIKEAQALRNRFTDCESGLPLARALPDVAVKEPTNRASDTLSPELRNLLADTPKGRLTTPNRDASGIEMIAVCDKTEDSEPTTLRERVQKELLNDKLAVQAEDMYKTLRASAVVSKN